MQLFVGNVLDSKGELHMFNVFRIRNFMEAMRIQSWTYFNQEMHDIFDIRRNMEMIRRTEHMLTAECDKAIVCDAMAAAMEALHGVPYCRRRDGSLLLFIKVSITSFRVKVNSINDMIYRCLPGYDILCCHVCSC